MLRLISADSMLPPLARKPGGIGNASPIARSKKRSNELFFVSETGKQCHIYVTGKAGFSPSKKRHPADDAEAPLPLRKKSLESARRLEQGRHGRMLGDRNSANHACCSTRPEVVRGGALSMHPSVPKSCRTASRVSADSNSRRRIRSSSAPARRQVSPH